MTLLLRTKINHEEGLENFGNNKRKKHENIQKIFHSMLNVDEQQDDIKHLKEQCDIYNEDEVQEITAAKNPIKRIRLCL